MGSDAGSEELEDYWKQEAEAEEVAPLKDVAEDDFITPIAATVVEDHDIDAANVKLAEAEAIDEEIDLNAKREIAPEQAKRMVNWQRKKFSVSIENADLDSRELIQRFPEGLMVSLYGENWDLCCPT